MDRKEYLKKLQSIKNDEDFKNLALEIFNYQAINNKVYKTFLSGLGKSAEDVTHINEIPFPPVELFKSHVVLTGNQDYERIFTSSGTTGIDVSKHYIKDVPFYEQICLSTFSSFYGNPSDYTILALLPSYLERAGSSLIWMMEKLISNSGKTDGGFYLNDHEKLFRLLNKLKQQGERVLLFGVTFALLDFVEGHSLDFPELTVMDTGGMKGRRKEMVREEVHEELCRGFGVKTIHSEYGMTELNSQAYSSGSGIFRTPPWMKILIRDTYDPLLLSGKNVTGGINILDLANIDSCAFIATQDLGKSYDDGSFEVLGRFDFSDVRGCNLMVD